MKFVLQAEEVVTSLVLRDMTTQNYTIDVGVLWFSIYSAASSRTSNAIPTHKSAPTSLPGIP